MAEPFRPCKLLGKLYVDRKPGNRPNQALLYKAVKVIKSQAPKKDKPQVKFTVTEPEVKNGRTRPSALVCRAMGGAAEEGRILMQQAMLTVVSVGHTNKSFVFVTVEPKDDEHMRFWVHAYSCKTAENAAFTASQLIRECSKARAAYQKSKQENPGRAKLTKEGSLSQPRHLVDPASHPDYSFLNDTDIRNVQHGPIDLGACLQEAHSILADNGPETVHTEDLDIDLSASALEEMYDLDCALKEHDVNTQLRGRLLDARQCGFNRQPADVSMMSNTSGVGAF